jgi:glutamate carboxypeptidase
VRSGVPEWQTADNDVDLTRLLVDDTRRLVEVESPSADLTALGACATTVTDWASALVGRKPDVLTVDGRPHLRWRWPPHSGGGRVLMLCHFDTVWPLGTLASMPFQVHGGVLRGPGSYDMKAGLAMTVRAIRQVLAADGADALAGLTLLCTSDEEIGSVSSRQLIIEAATHADVALVMEAAGPKGEWKTARKGVGMFHVAVSGRAAHAGVEPLSGVNATVELAHQVLAVTALADWSAGTSVVPTMAKSGTTVNTVPARADLRIDCRAWTIDEMERVSVGMRALTPVLPGAVVRVEGGINRPPMESALADQVYQRAVTVARGLGLSAPGRCSVGGGSDGNFTAGAGTPTLDGLGPVGGGAHADEEHLQVAELAPRTRLLAALLSDLLRSPLASW